MIMKRKHSGSFAVVPNITANDSQLSIDALGLLVFLLSKPNDWQVNVANLRKRFEIGRDRVYAILKQLETAGYVRKSQSKKSKSNQFCTVEYIVFDTQEAAKSDEIDEPLPENTDAGISIAYEEAASVFPVSGKQGRIQKTDITKPIEGEKSANAGASAPSETSQIWKEGRELLKQSPSQANLSIIGRWLKRVPTPEGKAKLRAMMRAAVEAGTGDPVSYVTAALAKEFPPLPSAKTFDVAKWQLIQRAAIKTKDWSEAWGPPPGRKGCAMPQHLVTNELTAALSARKIAA